jgi:hypothetical protein
MGGGFDGDEWVGPPPPADGDVGLVGASILSSPIIFPFALSPSCSLVYFNRPVFLTFHL